MDSQSTEPTALVHRVVRRTERGWVGHFICAGRCMFQRNTLLECDRTRIVVSTVGLMRKSEGTGFETIGAGRHYETMAFHAKYDGRYWDADVSRQVVFDSPCTIADWDADDVANDMHEAVVAEIAGKLERGETVAEREDHQPRGATMTNTKDNAERSDGSYGYEPLPIRPSPSDDFAGEVALLFFGFPLMLFGMLTVVFFGALAVGVAWGVVRSLFW